MTDELNWKSAFSDDSMDGFIDKASNAKDKASRAKDAADDALDKAKHAKDEVSDLAGSSDEDASATASALNALPPSPTPQTTALQQAKVSPQVEAALPTQVRQPMPQASQSAPQANNGGGRPLRKIFGALVAVVPLAIAAFVFLGGGDDEPEPFPEIAAPSGAPEVVDSIAAPDQNVDDATSLAFVFPEGRTDEDLDGVAGSGCTPGDGPLSDGVWFGYANALSAGSLDFDLACAWSGQAAVDQAAITGDSLGAAAFFVTNENAAGRTITPSADAVGWPLVAGNNPSRLNYSNFATTPTDTGAPLPLPVWVYINSGQATEVIAQNPSDLKSASAAAPTSNCDSGDAPQDQFVQVVGIAANDPDKGLNFRELPDPGSPIVGTFDNDVVFSPTGGCHVFGDGAVWWEVTGQAISGWANSRFLTGV